MVTLQEMITCAERELRLRKAHYPRWVRQNKITQKEADLEIARMRAIRDHLESARWRVRAP